MIIKPKKYKKFVIKYHLLIILRDIEELSKKGIFETSMEVNKTQMFLLNYLKFRVTEIYRNKDENFMGGWHYGITINWIYKPIKYKQ
jgi:hypothetical protein